MTQEDIKCSREEVCYRTVEEWLFFKIGCLVLFILTSQKLDRQRVVHPYNEMLFSQKRNEVRFIL